MTTRANRIAHSIKEELAWMLERAEIKDPRIGFVTITDVTLTNDLRFCRVYFSNIGGEEETQSALEGLNSALGFIRTEIGRRLGLRYAPELEFAYDPTVAAGARISKVLRDIREKDSKDGE